MKFEVGDIIVYCGEFSDLKKEKYFKVLKDASNNEYYQIQSDICVEWLNKYYVEKCYKLEKQYLRKKKLKKLK